MRLQIAFDLPDLESSLRIAEEVSEYADAFEIGTLLIYTYGESAVRTFREKFPQKMLLADAKIADRGKDIVTLFSQAGADWITVLAGTDRGIIHSTTQAAHELNKRVMLDLLDASSLGQSALEAKGFGVDALIFHRMAIEDTQLTFPERWDMVKGNTTLPVFIGGAITRETIHDIIAAKPAGLVLSNTITHADNPRSEAEFFYTLCKRSEQ